MHAPTTTVGGREPRRQLLKRARPVHLPVSAKDFFVDGVADLPIQLGHLGVHRGGNAGVALLDQPRYLRETRVVRGRELVCRERRNNPVVVFRRIRIRACRRSPRIRGDNGGFGIPPGLTPSGDRVGDARAEPLVDPASCDLA